MFGRRRSFRLRQMACHVLLSKHIAPLVGVWLLSWLLPLDFTCVAIVRFVYAKCLSVALCCFGRRRSFRLRQMACRVAILRFIYAKSPFLLSWLLYWLLAAGCWLLAASCWLLAAGC